MSTRRLIKGFTLIEMIITIAIIGILAAIAYPNYSQYVIDSRRSRAAGCVSEMAQYMERYYTTNQKYVTSGGSAPTLPTFECATQLSGHYTIAPSAVTASSFTLTATPLGGQEASDNKCGCALTLNQAGVRAVSAGCDKTAAVCWK